MSASTLTHSACARYGLMGLPLAFVAMPLYVVLPSHYGQTLGVPLGLLGMVLLGTRLADALVDPMIGRWVDRVLDSPTRARWIMALAALLLALGFGALFFPPVLDAMGLLAWCAATLVTTFAAYSVSSVLYLAWGTRLGGDVLQRSRLVAWREGCGLAGVVLANVMAVQSGMSWTTAALLLALMAGVWALAKGPQPEAVRPPQPGHADASGAGHNRVSPWQSQGFRRLMSLFLINGVASAIPATLVLFFIQDKLQAMAWAPVFLGSYFLSAAASVPWWVKQMKQRGLMPSWALGMGLSVLAFVGVMLLGAGDTWAYWLVCVASGWALGADLTIPGTLLTGVVQRAGHGGMGEGAYAGWWQWATKLNLALAAGLALPALQAMGYSPGAREPQALLALTLAYGLMPCVFKLTSLLLCWRWRAHAALV
jgi:GPH family glycoside/pentoside/hexuronide:cation symporter